MQVARPVVDREQPVTSTVAAQVRAPALIVAKAAMNAGHAQLSRDLTDLGFAFWVLEARRLDPGKREALMLLRE